MIIGVVMPRGFGVVKFGFFDTNVTIRTAFTDAHIKTNPLKVLFL